MAKKSSQNPPENLEKKAKDSPEKAPGKNAQEVNKDLEVKSSFKSFGNDATKKGGKNAKKASFTKAQSLGAKKKLPLIYIILGVLIAGALSLGLVYAFGFGGFSGIVSPLSDGTPITTEPQEEMVANPLTGEKYSKSEAPWINDRPLAVMVNNYIDARPQSGLVDADLVYEIVAEGGITRFIPFFLSKTPEKIGPVRSTRDYYLVLVKELGDAMIMHIGWSPQALEAIETWPVRSLGRGGGSFWRENPRNVATEHTAYVNGKDLRELGDELGWEGTREFPAWQFKDDSPTPLAEGPDSCETVAALCDPLTIDFWYEGDYSAIFKYNPDNNSYLRFTGYDANGDPIPHEDQDTGEQIEVKNVIVQFADESAIEGDTKNRLSYALVGSGTGLVFLDGTVEEVTWSKAERDARTMFYDLNGEEMQFNRGQFWISIVPTRNESQVKY
ncbi:DUF3048 domain-containing protein [candidate division WWE3 bacterium]|nr:DUF3048 domain-containing protein [candidate division WWE3 bacterium]